MCELISELKKESVNEEGMDECVSKWRMKQLLNNSKIQANEKMLI